MAKQPIGELIRLPIVHVLGTSKINVISQYGATVLLNQRVLKTTTVNKKPLSGNIVISIGDIDGAVPKAEVDVELNKKVPLTNVVQTTGQSTTLIISQKATTDLINNATQTISDTVSSTETAITLLQSRATALEKDKISKVDAYTKNETDTRFIKKVDSLHGRYNAVIDLTKDASASKGTTDVWKPAAGVTVNKFQGRALWLQITTASGEARWVSTLLDQSGVAKVGVTWVDTDGTVYVFLVGYSVKPAKLTIDYDMDGVTVPTSAKVTKVVMSYLTDDDV